MHFWKIDRGIAYRMWEAIDLYFHVQLEPPQAFDSGIELVFLKSEIDTGGNVSCRMISLVKGT